MTTTTTTTTINNKNSTNNNLFEFSEGWISGRLVDHKLPARASHRLHQALHEPRHQHPVQTTSTGESRSVLLPQPSGHRDLGVRDRCIPPGQPHDVRPGSVQPLRMVQPPPLQSRQQRPREYLHPVQRFLVRSWNAHAAGFWHQPEGGVHSDRWGYVVVLHSDHHLLVYGKPGSLSHRRTNGLAHRKRRGPG